ESVIAVFMMTVARQVIMCGSSVVLPITTEDLLLTKMLPVHTFSSFAATLLYDAEELSERQIRRNIQYRWMLRLILRQNTVPLCTERPPAAGRTPRDRDGSFTHPHGVMHLFPTGVKKVHCEATPKRLASLHAMRAKTVRRYPISPPGFMCYKM